MSKIYLSDIKPHLLTTLKDSELFKLIKKIQSGFTRDRDKISNYVIDESMVSAYASFYLPTNFPKLEFLLSKLKIEDQEKIAQSTIIDFGSGPGTFSLAFSNFYNELDLDVICIDSSTLMLKQAKALLSSIYPRNKFQFFTEIDSYSEKKASFNDSKTLFFGHSYNEISDKTLKNILELVDPEYVIFIEPGTKEVFDRLTALREFFNYDFDVLYPCQGLEQKCPIAERGDWCHQVLKTSHDQEVERISQKCSIDRRQQAVTMHVYKRKTSQDYQIDLRPTYVRYIKPSKFSFNFEVCLKEGEKLVLKTFQVPAKKLTVKEKKYLKSLNVGEKLDVEKVDEIKPDLWKIRLK